MKIKLLTIIFLIISVSIGSSSNAFAKDEEVIDKKSCSLLGYKFDKKKVECKEKKKTRKRKRCDKKKGEFKDGKCINRKDDKTLKKACKKKGLLYFKKTQTCSSIKKTKKRKKCEKSGGQFADGKCTGKKSKKEIRCLSDGGEYIKNKCVGSTSRKDIRKKVRKCEQDGFLYNPNKNSCKLKSEELKNCISKKGIFKKGRCKISRAMRKEKKEECNKIGYKYHRKKHACNKKVKTKERRKCDKRFIMKTDKTKQKAKFADGKCLMGKKDASIHLKVDKQICKLNGVKYDRLTNACSETKLHKKAKKCLKNKRIWSEGKCHIKGAKGILVTKYTEIFFNHSKISVTPVPKISGTKAPAKDIDGPEFNAISEYGLDDGSIVETGKKSIDPKIKEKKVNLIKNKKLECYNLGLKYSASIGNCVLDSKHKDNIKCEELKGKFKDGECFGAIENLLVKQAKRQLKTSVKSEAKKFRKALITYAKTTFEECKANPSADKKRCKYYFKLEKKFIRGMYRDPLFRGQKIELCLTKIKKDLDLEIATVLQKYEVAQCFKARNKRVIKSAILGVAAGASFFLLPGVGQVALGTFLVGKVKAIALAQVNKKIVEIEAKTVKHIKTFAIQEGLRLGQSTIDNVLKDVQTAFYKELGYSSEEIENQIKTGTGLKGDLTKKETRKLKKIQKRTTKEWRKSSLKLNNVSYKECLKGKSINKKQCKYIKRTTSRYIKSLSPKADFLNGKFFVKCRKEAFELKTEIEQLEAIDSCFRNRNQKAVQLSLLTMAATGLYLVSPDAVRKIIAAKVKGSPKKIKKQVLDDIKDETINKIIEETTQNMIMLTAPELDKISTFIKVETCKELKITCTDEAILGLGKKDKQEFFKTMKNNAKAITADAFKSCKLNSKFTIKQCREFKKIQNDMIKLRYNKNFLKGKKFSKCVNETQKNFPNQDSLEFRLSIHGCYKSRRKRMTNTTFIVIAAVAGAAVGYKYLPEQFHQWCFKELKSLVEDEIRKKTKYYQKGMFDEGIENVDVDSFVTNSYNQSIQKVNVKVIGNKNYSSVLSSLEYRVYKSIKESEIVYGQIMSSADVKKMMDQAKKEYYEFIKKNEGDYLTKSEKKGKKKSIKKYVKDQKIKYVEKMNKANSLCLKDVKMSKKVCKRILKRDKKYIKAVFNDGFFRSKSFQSCLTKSLALKPLNKDETEAQLEARSKDGIEKCFVIKRKKIIKSGLILVSVTVAAGITWNLADDNLRLWIEENIITKLEATYKTATESFINTEKDRLANRALNEMYQNGSYVTGQVKIIKLVNKKVDEMVKESILSKEVEYREGLK